MKTNNPNRPNYYAILTADVRYDQRLNPMQKLIFAELTALSNSQGFAFPSNEYLADLYGISTVSISRHISKLNELKYIRIEQEKRGFGTTRKIYILHDSRLNNNDKSRHNNSMSPPLNKIDKSHPINNTSTNTTSIYTESNNNHIDKNSNNCSDLLSLSLVETNVKKLKLKRIKPEVFYNYYSVRNWTTNDGIKITLNNLKNFLTIWDSREKETVTSSSGNTEHQTGTDQFSYLDKYYEEFAEEG